MLQTNIDKTHSLRRSAAEKDPSRLPIVKHIFHVAYSREIERSMRMNIVIGLY